MKVKIYVNGKYLETYKNAEAAKLRVKFEHNLCTVEPVLPRFRPFRT